MGATDPVSKLNKFLLATNTFVGMLQKPVPGINMQEIGKEIYGTLGYQDGTRFFTNDNPQVLQLQQQLQQAQGVIGQLQQKVAEKQTAHQIAMQKIIVDKDKAIQTTAMKEQGANQRALATHWAAMHKMDIEHARGEVKGTVAHQRSLESAQQKHEFMQQQQPLQRVK
jgi:TolA-binding protein